MRMYYFKLFLSLFFSALLMTGCGGKTEEDVAKAYYTAIANGKMDDAIAMIDFSSDSAKELGSMKEKLKAILEEVQKQIAKKGGLKSIAVSDKTLSEDGNKATLTLTLTMGDGSTKNERINLIKVDGVWKIEIH